MSAEYSSSLYFFLYNDVVSRFYYDGGSTILYMGRGGVKWRGVSVFIINIFTFSLIRTSELDIPLDFDKVKGRLKGKAWIFFYFVLISPCGTPACVLIVFTFSFNRGELDIPLEFNKVRE